MANKYCYIAIVFFLAQILPNQALADFDTELKLVHVSFRHGDRTPDNTDSFPTDPYANYSLYPVGVGHLTNVGKQSAFLLGRALRERYDSFLGTTFDSDIVEAWSTDFDRTKMSLLLVLAALFPPSKSQMWNDELPWLPIPYRYRPHNEDHFLKRPNDYCPAYLEELNNILGTVGEEIVKNNTHIFKYVEQHSGKKMNNLLDMFHVYQTLLSEESMNLTLPEWTKKVYPEPIASLAAQRCHLENYNTKLKRLNGGNILRRFLYDSEKYIDGTLTPKRRKIYLYSGHETNALNVLAALGMYDPPHVPGYAGAFVLELHYHKPTNEYGFKVLYRNGSQDALNLMTLPGCDVFCPYRKFITLTEAVVPKNYTEECNATFDIHTFEH